MGVALLAVAAGVGAPLYLRAVERDLERRVPDALAAAGFDGIEASFDGQEGTLRCAAPLPDPEATLDRAHDVRGVVLVELDRSCRVPSEPLTGSGDRGPDDTDSEGSDDPAGTEDTATTGSSPGEGSADETGAAGAQSGSEAATTAPDGDGPDGDGPGDGTVVDDDTADGGGTGDSAADEPAFASVDEIVTTSPRFSVLAALVRDAATDEPFGPTPLTLFAPTDEAFDALPADVLAELRGRPDQLGRLLRHHVTDGVVTAAELAPGDLSVRDGGTVTVARQPASAGTNGAGTNGAVTNGAGTNGAVTIGPGALIDADLRARDGVVHVIDTVLVPADLDLDALAGTPAVVATVRGGRMELSGDVTTVGLRDELVAAARSTLDPSNVTDELTVVADEPAPDPVRAAAQRFVDLVALAPRALTTGTVGFDVDRATVVVRGTVVDATAEQEMRALAGPDDLVDLASRPVATAADAAEVAAELDALLAVEPIRFAPGTAEPVDADAVLDRLAGVVERFAGIVVTVEGHTDTVGDADQNQALSEFRAAVVRLELIERGVPEDQLAFVGRGEQDPVTVDGVEDREASRRVETVVELVDPDSGDTDGSAGEAG